MPSAAASRGVRIRTGCPSQKICPWSGAKIPAMVLIVTDLPAPLSPISAVTWPAGSSRSMSWSACTGPKFFETPSRRRRGSAPFSVVVIASLLEGLRRAGRAPPRNGRGPSQGPVYWIPASLHALATFGVQRAEAVIVPSLTTVSAMFSLVTQKGFVYTDLMSAFSVVSLVVSLTSEDGGVLPALR